MKRNYVWKIEFAWNQYLINKLNKQIIKHIKDLFQLIEYLLYD